MDLPFAKLQGAGNDFVLIDNREGVVEAGALAQLARRVCARRVSVGADGLLVLEVPRAGGAVFARIINADGSEAEMCGNGMRCVARFLDRERVVIETAAGLVEAERVDRSRFRIRLPDPAVVERGVVEALGRRVEYTYVELGSPGIPHVVVLEPPDLELARALRHHERFPKGANVNFVANGGSGRGGPKVRRPPGGGEGGGAPLLFSTYERGVEAFTLACGTGAGSTAVALKRDRVSLQAPGGLLEVEVSPGGLWLTGDTVYVARGFFLTEG